MQTTVSQPRRTIFSSILRGSGLYLAAIIATRAASILLLPVTTRFLTTADYGVLDLIDQVNSVLSLVLGGGLGAAFSFFFFEKSDSESRREVVGTTLTGAFLIGCLSGALGFVFAPQISLAVFGTNSYAFYLRLLFFSMPMNFLLETTLSWLRIEDRAATFLVFTLVRISIVSVGTVALLAWFHLGMLGVLSTTVGSVIALAVGMTAFCVRAARPRLNMPLFLQIMRYSLPLGFGGIALFVVHFGDRFILPHYRSLSELGIYGLGYKIAILISFLYSSFHTYWSARVFEIARREDGGVIFTRTFTYVITCLSFSALALLVSCRPVLHILATSAFQGAGAIMPLILLAYYVRAIGDYFRCFFLVAKRPVWDASCNWIGSIVCLIGYFALIPRYGMWGAGSATLISFCVISLISVVGARRLYPVQIETGRVAKVLVALLLPTAGFYLLPRSSLVGQIALGTGLLLVFPAVLFLLRFPTEGEKEMPLLAYRRAKDWLARRELQTTE